MLFYSVNVYAQNLVPNGSFEDYTSCPDGVSQIIKATGWMTFHFTPDYFSECATSNYVAVPSNQMGYQYPFEGIAYAGVITYHFPIETEDHEFIATELSQPLQIGSTYHISFRTCVGVNNGSGCLGTNHIGVKFSNTLYSQSTPMPVDNNPAFDHPFFITDTVGWTLVSGTYVPDSNYTYMAIGNFFPSSLTDTINITNYNNAVVAYYYIDSVNVTCISCPTGTASLLSQSSISRNPFTTSTTITLNSSTPPLTIQLFDATGREAPMQYHTAQQTNSTVLTLERGGLRAGVYFLVVSTQHVREVVRLMVE